MRAMGIDVGLRKGLDTVVLDDARSVLFNRRRVVVAELGKFIDDYAPDIVAIDSPPRFASGGRRATEVFVTSLGLHLYTTPWRSERQSSSFYDWMRGGFAVFAECERHGYALFTGDVFRHTSIEVFPDACAA